MDEAPHPEHHGSGAVEFRWGPQRARHIKAGEAERRGGGIWAPESALRLPSACPGCSTAIHSVPYISSRP
eukprot:3715129-Alexandrium_andersonii.AAC.1